MSDSEQQIEKLEKELKAVREENEILHKYLRQSRMLCKNMDEIHAGVTAKQKEIVEELLAKMESLKTQSATSSSLIVSLLGGMLNNVIREAAEKDLSTEDEDTTKD